MGGRIPRQMRWSNILLVALVSAGLLSCGGEEQPPPPPPSSLGSVVINWELQDPSGEVLRCEDLSLSNASVRLGPESVEVPCGDDQTVRFERLLFGNYGVTISLFVAGRGLLQQDVSNLTVVANEEVVHDVMIVVDRDRLTKGSIFFKWTVSGGPAAANCGGVGAETVMFETTASSISQFTKEVDCVDGELLVESLDPGVYEVRAALIDANAERVGALQSFDILVMSGERVDWDIIFFGNISDPAAFEGSWTITGSAAVDACEALTADQVRLTVQTRPPGMVGVDIATATAACTAGQIRMANLPSGGSIPVRAVFVLSSEFLGALDTQTTPSFFLRPGATSTAAVDFEDPR